MQSDAEIVSAVLAGERSAFALLVQRYGRMVRATALGVLGDLHAAEDVEQEAFVAAYRKLPTLRASARFGPWLMIITRRLALDALRHRRTRRNVPLDGLAEPADPSDNGEFDDTLEPLLAAVMRLPDLERQAVMLRYFGDRSVRSVAEIMSCPVGTVTKQLWRARRRLRGWLAEMDP